MTKKCADCELEHPDDRTTCFDPAFPSGDQRRGCGSTRLELLPAAAPAPPPLDLPGLTAPAAPPIVATLPPPPAPPPAPPPPAAPPPPPLSDSSRAFLERMRNLGAPTGRRRPRIILMFGFSATGKTFFIARAKDAQTGLGYTRVDPEPEIDGNPENWNRGRPIPGTQGLEVHTLSHQRDFVALVDIEGEVFNGAMRRGFGGGAEENDDLLLAAIAYADAYIFIAPAAETLEPVKWDHRLGELARARGENYELGKSLERLRRLAANTEQLIQFIQFIAQRRIKTRADQQRGDDQVVQAIAEFKRLRQQDKDQLQALVQASKTAKPALLLLSKADAYKTLINGDDTFDCNPVQALTQAPRNEARLLIKSMAASFKTFRIDFLTTVDGHDEHQLDGAANGLTTEQRQVEQRRLDLDRAHFGVRENFNWLKKSVDASRGLIRGPLDPGVGPAIMLRRRLNPEFGRIFNS